MVNQWGRDGNSSSGGGRSGGGIVIPALVALVIGGAGGYGGGRFFSGVSASDLQSRDNKINELQQSLSEMKFDTNGANSQQAALQGRVKELEGQIAAANRTKEALRADTDKQVAAARRQAQAEIDALQKTLDEAGDVNGQLGRARKSLKVSELQIIELEKLTEDQKAQIDALLKAADANGGEAAATLAALKKTNANLRASLEDAKQKLDAIPRLEDEIAGLKEQLSQKATDASAEARNQIASLQKDKDSLQRQLNDALKASGDTDAKARQITELRKQLDDITAQLADKDEAARDAQKDLKKAKADLEKSDQLAKSLESENETLRDAQGELAKQVDALKAELVKATVKPVDDTKPADDKPADTGMKPRDRDDVEKAVGDLPGFDNLSDAKQQTLVGMLEKGECVTTSLKAAYGHVPAVALRNLIRELGGRC